MDIMIAGTHVAFHPWNPRLGPVFDGVYAFDCETARIDETRPWITPPYVLGAASDGRRGYFITRQHAAAFLAAHEQVPMVLHHATFDLAVLHLLDPVLDIYRLVDEHLIWDTQLLHRLYMLMTEGHTASGKGQSTLDRCARHYLGIDLPKDVVDARGQPVRLSYGQWLNRPAREIEPVYLDYLARDVLVTYRLFEDLRARIRTLLESSAGTWGYVSPSWLAEQVQRWGWLTHHIQLKAAVVLAAITANGLYLDLPRREELIQGVIAVADDRRKELAGYGYVPGQGGSKKALLEILRRLEAKHTELDFPRTPTGAYATSEEALAPLAAVEPFVASLLAYRNAEKLRSSFLEKMGRRVLHPSFDVLKTTGRTSSFGAINAQNLPRDERIRNCFTPAPGHVFVNADYSAIEMLTLAQAVMGQFGIPSQLAEVLNTGADPHRRVAALATGKPEAEVTKQERQRAKPINFGKPGGMGPASLRDYARASYGVEMSEAEVEQLSEAWFALFPEMRVFLDDDADLGLAAAELFGLTPMTYFEHTGSRKFLDHPHNMGFENQPHPALGGMCLKVLKVADPETRAGRPYDTEELDFFWTRVEARIDMVPSNHRLAVRQRRPSATLQRAVLSRLGRAGVFTLTGRLRANASYSARHNSVFQGLAADGAKLALWKLWRAGYRIANFIHDEVLVEIPEGSDLEHHVAEVTRLMVAGMKAVVPDVRIAVEAVVTTAWSKQAETVRDGAGRLVPWQPKVATAPAEYRTAV